jgi:hypothetical protein
MTNLVTHWLLGGQTVPTVLATNTTFFHIIKELVLTKFRNSEKATKEEVRKALMNHAVENTENTFTVTFQSDGSGPCVVLMVERDIGEDHDGRSPFINWESLPAKFMGWRTIFVHVPHGYITVFYDSAGNLKVTPMSE